jgi:hypothetical protein
MMSDQQAMTIYTARKRDMSDDSFYTVGTIAIGPRGVLELKSAGEGFEEPLQNILRNVNALMEFRIKVPSPPGSAPYSLDARTVDRESPDLETALCDFLLQRYGLLLTRFGTESEDIDYGPAAPPIPEPNWLVPPDE